MQHLATWETSDTTWTAMRQGPVLYLQADTDGLPSYTTNANRDELLAIDGIFSFDEDNEHIDEIRAHMATSNPFLSSAWSKPSADINGTHMLVGKDLYLVDFDDAFVLTKKVEIEEDEINFVDEAQ